MYSKLSVLFSATFAEDITGFRQSPIDLPSSGYDIDHVILDDPYISLEYGDVCQDNLH
jgi:hypothetical protein